VVLDCPTLKPGTFTTLDSPPLDKKNRSMNALHKKGFENDNCFVFDSFPRRVKFGKKKRTGCNKSGDRKRVPRDIWPEFIESHDELHTVYRKHGGQIMLLMGNNAEKAWRDIIKDEQIDAVKLEHSEAFDVWAEISKLVFSSLTMKVAEGLGFREKDQSDCD
jgi:hypothetical protein